MAGLTYWERREKIYEQQVGANLKELHRQYNNAFKTLKAETESLYLEINSGQAIHSHYYQYNKYYDLMNQIDKEMQKLGQASISINNNNFSQLYQKNFSIVKNELQFKGEINSSLLESALNSIWCPDGKHWSSRVWGNVAQLEQKLRDGISNSLLTGKSPAQLIKDIRTDFGTDFYKAERIVRTEMSVIQNKSTLDTYKTAGVEKYQILANQADDEICGDLDNDTFSVEDAVIGENFPPFHPNCRCSIVAVTK